MSNKIQNKIEVGDHIEPNNIISVDKDNKETRE